MIPANITTESRNGGYRVEFQIHNGNVSMTECTDADQGTHIIPGLDGYGDMQVALPDLLDLITRLVDASTFKTGDKVTWRGKFGAQRTGTVHSVDDDADSWNGPTVTVRTDKGGYTKVAAVHLERI